MVLVGDDAGGGPLLRIQPSPIQVAMWSVKIYHEETKLVPSRERENRKWWRSL